MTFPEKFFKADWLVKDCDLKLGQDLVKQYHYVKGGSNTCVYMHGLYYKPTMELVGVAWWLPPTRVACESVNKNNWTKVLSLTRLVIVPNVPKNACSFLLSKSVNLIKKDGRFTDLVTYADESQHHVGTIYKASNWVYIGKTGPYPRWIDPKTGKQVAQKATVNRVKAKMLEMGFVKVGSFYKHKYTLKICGDSLIGKTPVSPIGDGISKVTSPLQYVVVNNQNTVEK